MVRRFGLRAASLTPLCPPGGLLLDAPDADRLNPHGRPQEEDLQGQEPQPQGERVAPRPPGPQRLPPLQLREAAPRGVRQLRLVRRPGGPPGRRDPPPTPP